MDFTRRDLIKVMLSASIGLPLSNLLAKPVNKQIRVLHLFYHHIGSRDLKYWRTKQEFENDLRLLRSFNFRSISCSDLVSHFKDRKPLPERSLLISFDDGYYNVVDNALPVLRKYGYHACFFLVAGWIGKDRGRYILSWRDVDRLLREGHDVQSHTWSHPNLTKPLTKEQWDIELGLSKELLERETGKAIRFIAYPYGAHNEAVINQALLYSYEAGFTTRSGLEGIEQNLYCLRRDQPGIKHETDEILAKYQGFYGYRINPKPNMLAKAKKRSNLLAKRLEKSHNPALRDSNQSVWAALFR